MDSSIGQTQLYGYVPTQYVAYIFVVLFILSTLTHGVQAVWTRAWWLLPTACFAGSIEVVGWVGRLWSSYSPTAKTPFQIQILATIVAPTPLIAANFMILGRIILRLGPSYSRLRPTWYAWTFLGFDIIGFFIQMIGGLMILSATSSGSDPSRGVNIVIIGIIFQLCAVILFALCGTEFFLRYLYERPCRKDAQTVVGSKVLIRGDFSRRLRILTAVLVFGTVCLFIRAIYRTTELLEGWGGHSMSVEWYFNVFDGAMVTLALISFNFAHPGYFLSEENSRVEHPESYKLTGTLPNGESAQFLA
ncbi:hypothetical protein ONZ45_g8101 [Pleurotus djamor]|nr:hypothetical protein ONZ45_g8101 [Pleurotus djamor]